jgi:iron(III) transport system ATP-binding protein
MSLLSVSGIHKRGLGDFALQDITFKQHKNQKIAIAGETGSGKSTLLKIIAGLEQPDSGEVLFYNEHVRGPHENLVPGHSSIAYLGQAFELPKFLRVEQVLMYANHLTKEAASELFEVCEISHLLKRRTDEVSGGERQRIALTKLLITSPQLLLLDEPFSNLDVVHKNVFKKVLKGILKRLKITCMLVSHDPGDVLSWADKIIVMRSGKIVQKDSPKKIYERPANEYVAGLFGSYSLISDSQSSIRPWGIKSKGKKILIRPEELKIVNQKTKSIRGKVTHVSFFGSHDEADVDIGDLIVQVMCKKDNVKVGDDVHLRFAAKRPTYVD